MINRVILTLLKIRSKKEPNDYLIAGSGTFFMLWLNAFSLAGIYCIYRKINFIELYLSYSVLIMTGTIIGFVGAQLYARYIQKENKTGTLRMIPGLYIFLYFIFSVLSSIIILYHAAKMFYD